MTRDEEFFIKENSLTWKSGFDRASSRWTKGFLESVLTEGVPMSKGNELGYLFGALRK